MYNSPEFHREEQNELVARAFEKAIEILAQDQIQLDDFNDLYGDDKIAQDKAYVKKRKADFEAVLQPADREHLKLATIFEAILHQHGEQSNWFGEAAITIKASEFDDIAHGVDEIVEFEEEKSRSYLALAIDATYSQFTDRKLNKIKDEIDRGELTRIKYAVLEGGDTRAELNRVPRVIVGVSPQTILQLSELWLSGKNSELAIHPVQLQILESILMQAKIFGEYADSIGKPEIAKKYLQIIAILEPIFQKKQTDLNDTGKRDDVAVAIDLGLNRFRKEK